MINGHKTIAFIPARGGSKGIPGKNLRLINGIPLIAYSILAAKRLKEIDYVFVSTDSKKIANVSKRFGACVPFLRPDELASDQSKTIDSVLYSLKRLKESGLSFDNFVLLQPTSPCRDSDDIRNALTLFEDKGRVDLASIHQVEVNPLLLRTQNGEGELTPLIAECSTVRRQDLPKYYKINGSIYINRCECLNEKTSFNDNPLGFVLDPSHSTDIDCFKDLETARKYWKGKPPIE